MSLHFPLIQPEIDRLTEEYEGRIKLVFMHFPLVKHHNSQILAEASLCAQRQGEFWSYKDRLFTIRGSCSASGENNVIQKVINYAKDVGLNIKKFKGCLGSSEVKEAILNDKKQGLGLGVKQTPTLFIEGEKIEGYKSYQELKEVVENHLNK